MNHTTHFDDCGCKTARLENEIETLRVQLAACGVAAMQNTEESATQRIDKLSPYWSASYGDVCRAVDSEMCSRAALASKDAEMAELRALLEEARELIYRLRGWSMDETKTDILIRIDSALSPKQVVTTQKPGPGDMSHL